MKSIPNLDTNNVIPVYGNNATGYLEPPTDLQREKGVIPLDSLPADWWNWLWNNTTKNLNSACLDINALYSEIIAVLAAAGISPQENSTVELKNAIIALTKVVATSTNPGAIKSSSNAGQISINAEGLGTVNCLGSPTSLATTNKTIVGAINELNTALSTLTGTTLPNTYAPISHASAGTTYGVASASQYGHIKVTTGNGLSISNGVLSMGNAVISTTTYPGACCTGTVTAVCYNGTKYNPTSGVVNLGNAPTAFPGYYTGNGTAPGTASAGTSTLVSRGDHVHPLPWAACNTIKIGQHASVCYSNACEIVIGYNATSRDMYGTVIGGFAYACCCGTSLGYGAYAHCFSTAVGSCACSTADYGTAIGYYACAFCTGSTAIGYCAVSKSSYDVAIGSCACSYYGISIGYGACSCLGNSVAIGCGVSAFHKAGMCCSVLVNLGKRLVALCVKPGTKQCDAYDLIYGNTYISFPSSGTSCYYYPAFGTTSNGCVINNIATCSNKFMFRNGTSTVMSLYGGDVGSMACGFSLVLFAHPD